MTLRHNLRHETADLHRALDERILSDRLFETREGYTRWLGAMHVFYAAARRALQGLDAPDLVDPSAWEARMSRIARDLGDLGCSIPDAPSEPRLAIADDIDAIGLLYVTEGASLGARLLVRQAQALGFDAGFGARHLSAEAQASPSWRRISAILDTRRLDAEASARMVRVSQRTFSLAVECFGGHHDEP